MSPSELPTILVTEEHLLSAGVTTHGQRLLDVLNDSNTDFLPVGNVEVLRRRCGTCVGTLPQAVIRKEHIALAIPAGDGHEAPAKRARTFQSKKRYAAFLLVLGYEVRGEVSLKGPDDPKIALCHEFRNFFPVPHGQVSFAGTRHAEQESQVVIVNKDFVSLFQIADPTTGDAKPPRSNPAEVHRYGASPVVPEPTQGR